MSNVLPKITMGAARKWWREHTGLPAPTGTTLRRWADGIGTGGPVLRTVKFTGRLFTAEPWLEDFAKETGAPLGDDTTVSNAANATATIERVREKCGIRKPGRQAGRK
jgi:hypothetical protein